MSLFKRTTYKGNYFTAKKAIFFIDLDQLRKELAQHARIQLNLNKHMALNWASVAADKVVKEGNKTIGNGKGAYTLYTVPSEGEALAHLNGDQDIYDYMSK